MSTSVTRISDQPEHSTEIPEKLAHYASFFITTYEYVYERRLQTLLFYTDTIYTQEHGERLFNVTWKRCGYGTRSPELTTLLDEFQQRDATVEVELIRGNSITRYDLPPTDYFPPDIDKSFIVPIQNETATLSTETLESWVVNLVENTPFDNRIDITTLVEDDTSRDRT